MNLKTVKLGVLAVLVLIMSLGLTTTALADKPFCSNADMPTTIVEGQQFTITWTGSNPVRRAWMVVAWDGRGHWLGGTLRHNYAGFAGRFFPFPFGRLSAPYAQELHNFLLTINESPFEKTLSHSGTTTMTLPADLTTSSSTVVFPGDSQLIIQTWWNQGPEGHDNLPNRICKTDLPWFEVVPSP